MIAVTGFRRLQKNSLFWGVIAALVAVTCGVSNSATAQPAAKPIAIAASAIGRPPIFSNTFADVAEAMGFFKAAGVDVSFRWFQRGADTAKAVVTGDVAVGLHRVAAGPQPDRGGRGCGRNRRYAQPGLDRRDR